MQEKRVAVPKIFSKLFEVSRKKVKERLGFTGSSHSRLLYIHETLSKLGFSFQPALAIQLEQEFWRTFISNMSLEAGVRELLTNLRFNNVKIALVTDLTLQIQLKKLIYLDLDKYFDLVVASEEAGGDKVSLKPFKVLSERCEAGWLDYVWFVGDSESDLPLEELQKLNLVKDGATWLKNGNSGTEHISWKNFTEIEASFTEVNS